MRCKWCKPCCRRPRQPARTLRPQGVCGGASAHRRDPGQWGSASGAVGITSARTTSSAVRGFMLPPRLRLPGRIDCVAGED
jgi:hypothetical protein